MQYRLPMDAQDPTTTATVAEAAETWELRWTATELPVLEEAWPTLPSDTRSSTVIEDHDVYLLTRSPLMNLKLRRRTNTLKLKRLRRRSSEGFELWRTEFDLPLPVGAVAAERALGLLHASTQTEALSVVASIDEALEVISTLVIHDRIVEVRKRRRLYEHGPCLVDDARFEIEGSAALRSIGVESNKIEALRISVDEMDSERLATPCNYTQFLHRRI